MKYKISAEQYLEIKAAQKANRDKQIANRLKVLALRYEGKNLEEIAAATGFHHAHISNLIRKYFEEGLPAISEKHYAGNRRNMSKEEEAAFLEQCRQLGEAGDTLVFIPPYTPEVNPIEQIWKELRKRGFRNAVFASLGKVVDRLCNTICSLTACDIFSITAHSWILSCFY